MYVLKFWEGEDPAPVVQGKNGAYLFVSSNSKVGDAIEGDKTLVEVGVTVPDLSRWSKILSDIHKMNIDIVFI